MTDLCALSDLDEGSSLGFLSHRGPVFAVKYDNEVYVYQNECPHLGVNLEFLENEFLDADGTLIQCSTHGALFAIDTGLCLAGPCQGDQLKPIAFSIEAGRIVLT
ncbi:Rieske (2Fe-2S) protein [Reinekea sp.]|jgi:nitrite reductase/ring-hydroxylating ferredoxin subunit|uniref:Rieske (2Fe-2S) protein n=1 Tax=Reinekea sp. TaxID=1970455 RepID=UPI002A83D3EE|nr:Rieske (2Fe-2S) protein [Reinekea sp.]